MKASVFIATSLDGFIARTNGGIDWLPSGNGANGEDYGYAKFIDSVDTLVMGRKTFETAMTFSVWPYGKKSVIVLSRRLRSLPKRHPKSVEIMSCAPAELLNVLAKRGVKHIYVDGGKTIQGFLRAGLINQVIITRVPVLIGRGIPLFGALQNDLKLRHVKTRCFDDGLVQSSYQISA